MVKRLALSGYSVLILLNNVYYDVVRFLCY